MSNANRGRLVRNLEEFRGFQQAEPELGWWPKPHAKCSMTILGREIFTEVDEFGYRLVPGQPAIGDKTLAVFGCSFTFGWTLPVEETFCAILQQRLPSWRIENHGMIGFGTAHHHIQIERMLKFESPDYLTIGWVPHHQLRMVAEAKLIQAYQWPQWNESPINGHPKVYLDEHGDIRTRVVPFKRPDIKNIDLSDFSPDPHYKDLVTFRVFQSINERVRQKGGHFFVTVLHETLTPGLRKMMEEHGIAWVDAAIAGLEYTNHPDDLHPNGRANIHFADQIENYLMER